MENKAYETRAVKRLETSKETGVYQKRWFLGLRERVEAGEPFAIVGANTPMELLRAMDIPFVVNQWWTAICAAKQQGPRFYGLLAENGYRSDICSYCAAAYACSLDPRPEEGPWGGLPRPTLAINGETCSSGMKIEELMCKSYGIPSFRIQHRRQDVFCHNWWEKSENDWETLVGRERLDHYERELVLLTEFLERETGRRLDRRRLIETLELVNEQDTWLKKTRDLIAKTRPAPVSVTDTVNAVMQLQWHRGTRWGADTAKKLYDEVSSLVSSGKAAVPNERIRLMWIGRGLWFNLAFYQHFEEKYGAVFVWTMYLAMAADSYIRNFAEEKPLRSLASRFAFLEDVLHVPPFNGEWFVKEAENNMIDGVVFLVPENCMNNGDFGVNIIRALEAAGYPVCVLHADPADSKKWSQEEMTAAVEMFIENRIGGKPDENE